MDLSINSLAYIASLAPADLRHLAVYGSYKKPINDAHRVGLGILSGLRVQLTAVKAQTSSVRSRLCCISEFRPIKTAQVDYIFRLSTTNSPVVTFARTESKRKHFPRPQCIDNRYIIKLNNDMPIYWFRKYRYLKNVLKILFVYFLLAITYFLSNKCH